LVSCAATICLCGGDATQLPLVRLGTKWLSASGLAAVRTLPARVFLTDDYRLGAAYEASGSVFHDYERLNRNVLITTARYPHKIFEDADHPFFGPVEKLVQQALSKAWGAEVSASQDGAEVDDNVYCEGTVFYRR